MGERKMKTAKSKTKYEVHGREFEDPAKAKAFELLLTAKEAYEDARKQLGRVLAESFVTADGHPFRFQHWTYYYIFRPCGSLPRLVEVSFLYWSRNFEAYQYGEETDLVLYTSHDPWGNERENKIGYPIRELYAHRDKAEEALQIARRLWLREELAELDQQASKT